MAEVMGKPLDYCSPPSKTPLEPRCPYCGGEVEDGFVVSGAILRWAAADTLAVSRALIDITDIWNKAKIAGVTGAKAIRCHPCERIVIAT